jgi:hypothetical protein
MRCLLAMWESASWQLVTAAPTASLTTCMPARRQSRALAEQLRAAQRNSAETLRLREAAWARAERIRALWLAAHPDADRLRYSAYARLQARLATMPVIEQAKGIIMAQCGWSADQAFDALRRASQRENIKVRDLAAAIVAKTASAAPAQPQTSTARAGTQSWTTVTNAAVPAAPARAGSSGLASLMAAPRGYP